MPVLLWAGVALWAAGFGGVQVPDLPIGFVSHYPFVLHEDDQVAATGATVLEVRAPWALLQPQRGQWDFSPVDRQLAWARDQGLKLVYILECGPAHAAPWVRDLVRRAGQETRDPDGRQQSDPSIFSPVYRDLVREFIAGFAEYLTGHDREGTVVGYNNGCEWWYPLVHAYSPLDVAGFRAWLGERYGSLEVLNASWQADWAAWDEVDAPRLTWIGLGGPDDPGVLYPFDAGTLDCSYNTVADSHVAVEPGREYELRALCDLDAVKGEGAFLEIAWLAPDQARPVALAHSESASGTRTGVELVVRARAPATATRAWLLLKFRGEGKVVYRSVAFAGADGGEDLAPNPGLDAAVGRWTFIAWAAGQEGSLSHAWPAAGEATIEYHPTISVGDGRVGNGTAAVHDWTRFLQESVAEFIDWIAAEVKSADPSRPVITYLTFSFAQAFHWDYVVGNSIALDWVCEKAAHQDVIGMQIAAGDGDYHHVTAALDLARKYGKPMWAIDLLDFTGGVAVGKRSLLRTSLSVVQHGGSGISYYCWWGTPDYNFAELGVEDLRDMIGTTRAVAAELRDLQPVAEVALVEPLMPVWAGLPAPANDFRDFMGWYKLLLATGLCPDVFTLHELETADLTGYRLVVVPDCAYLADEPLACLQRAAAAGVPLLLSGDRFASRDLGGRPRPPVRWPEGAGVLRHEAWGRSYLGPIRRMVKAGNTPGLFLMQPGAPRYGGPERGRLNHVLGDLGIAPAVDVRPAQPGVEACLLRAGARRKVLLLNGNAEPTPPLSVSVGEWRSRPEAIETWRLDDVDAP